MVPILQIKTLYTSFVTPSYLFRAFICSVTKCTRYLTRKFKFNILKFTGLWIRIRILVPSWTRNKEGKIEENTEKCKEIIARS